MCRLNAGHAGIDPRIARRRALEKPLVTRRLTGRGWPDGAGIWAIQRRPGVSERQLRGWLRDAESAALLLESLPHRFVAAANGVVERLLRALKAGQHRL